MNPALHNISELLYLFSSILFILTIKYLSSPINAPKGIILCLIATALAIISTLLCYSESLILVSIALVLGGAVGLYIAKVIDMRSVPQLIAGFHSFVGIAAVLISCMVFLSSKNFSSDSNSVSNFSAMLEIIIGAIIGSITFSGSIIAFCKLQAIFIPTKAIKIKNHQYILIASCILIILLSVLVLLTLNKLLFLSVLLLSLLVGIFLILPIAGADMPVIVSVLNSFSGWACVGVGFSLDNNLLIITGSLIGASGAILSSIMCKSMNRSLFNVMFKSFFKSSNISRADSSQERYPNQAYAQDAAIILKNAQTVIIIPGYGMAVSQAQHVIKSLFDTLNNSNVLVKFAIHPVAGRMPGHMNVLLAEANIDHNSMYELENINSDFKNTDVVLVIGANDITNPAAKNDPQSPIFGMPIFDVDSSKTVLFIKRSLSTGYSAIENEIFFNKNTLMLFGDAKKTIEEIIRELKMLT